MTTNPRTTEKRRTGPAWTPEAALRALGAAGLVSEQGTLQCPRCGRADVKSKFAIKGDGAVHHHRCGQQAFPADILMVHNLGVPWDNLFSEDAAEARKTAFRWLAGAEDTGIVAKAPPAKFNIDTATSVVDVEVFTGISHYINNPVTRGKVAAAAFYGRWHISPKAVEAYRFGYIINTEQFNRALVERFGEERLLACGLFIAGSDGTPHSLVSARYPVIEPHTRADGKVTFLQLRASAQQEQRIAAHKRGEIKYPGEKFLSLKGSPRTAQLGGGLPLLAAANPGDEIVIVEGLKDAAAGYTLGKLCFGIPGANFLPGASTVELLVDKKVTISLDGDDAGTSGAARLADHLRDAGVKQLRITALPPGADVTDVLVDRHRSEGCRCDACEARSR